MSDFNDLCDVFDKLKLKYSIKEHDDGRWLTVKGKQDKVEYVGLRYNAVWFEFDKNGTFMKFVAEE